jgi:hypothetical protein
MRIDGHFHQKLNFGDNGLRVWPGDWFWYKKKKYLISFVNLRWIRDGNGTLYIYCGEEIGVPG